MFLCFVVLRDLYRSGKRRIVSSSALLQSDECELVTYRNVSAYCGTVLNFFLMVNTKRHNFSNLSMLD